MDKRGLGYTLAFGSAATGALRFNLAVYAEQDGFGFVSFLFWSLVVGIACCAVHVAVRDGRKGFLPLRGRWHHALLYGLLMGWGTLTHFLALEYLNETVMSSLAQTGLLITIGLAVWLLKERFTTQEWLATIVICSGVLLFRPWEVGNLAGMFLLFSGVVAGAFASIGAKVWVAGTPPRVLMLWRNLIALLVVGTYAAVTRPTATVTPGSAVACIAAGVLGPYLHGLFFLMALERIEASKASLMGRVAPVLIFLVSWVALDRLPQQAEIYSSAVLLAGTIWLARARPKTA
ncbi:MAG: DMT family transporter [Planctomycetota bacterium]